MPNWFRLRSYKKNQIREGRLNPVSEIPAFAGMTKVFEGIAKAFMGMTGVFEGIVRVFAGMAMTVCIVAVFETSIYQVTYTTFTS